MSEEQVVTWNKLKDAKITAGSNSFVTCVYVTNARVEARTEIELANAALENKRKKYQTYHDMKKIDGLLCGVRGEDTLDTLKFSSSDFIDPYAKLGTNLSTKEHHKNSRLRNGASYEKYFTIHIDPGVSNYFNRPWNKRIGHTQDFK